MKTAFLYCPVTAVDKYIAYMKRREIKYQYNGIVVNQLLRLFQAEFEIPANLRPHMWKLT